jgi:hypothetical protein
MMQVRVVRSGRRHKVGLAHILYVMATVEPITTAAGALVWYGLDDRGVALEIVAVSDDKTFNGLAVIPRCHVRFARRRGVAMTRSRGVNYEAGPDLDLDREEFTFEGERLTNERAERIAKEALRELRTRNLVPGRKSLSGAGVHSPRINIRLPDDIYVELQRQAEVIGESVSKLTREVLSAFVAGEGEQEFRRLRKRVEAATR